MKSHGNLDLLFFSFYKIFVRDFVKIKYEISCDACPDLLELLLTNLLEIQLFLILLNWYGFKLYFPFKLGKNK